MDVHGNGRRRRETAGADILIRHAGALSSIETFDGEGLIFPAPEPVTREIAGSKAGLEHSMRAHERGSAE